MKSRFISSIFLLTIIVMGSCVQGDNGQQLDNDDQQIELNAFVAPETNLLQISTIENEPLEFSDVIIGKSF
ncbi:hypothetical protein [Robertkochia solimangrovi]|uniref:hypothetical protein n=1 Tax=Robertkochia solimangrovi TaxID=2213046 RepID=UPI00117DFC58|nr:hypothetical protein [Robertkochia solimangrovi]